MVKLIIFFLFFVLASPVHGMVIINEISPRSSPEWVELYNTDVMAVDLTGWYLVDAASHKKDLSPLGSIPGNSYLIFTGVDSWLNNDQDSLTLFNSGNVSLDSVSFGETEDATTIARVPNITGSWFTSQAPSQGSANLSPSPTPSPTPLPSPVISPSPTAVAQTPTPSPSPSPSQFPSPSPTLVPSPTPKPSPRLSPSPSPDLESSPEGTVAGESTKVDLSAFGIASIAPSPSTQASNNSGLKLRTDRLKNLLMIGGGLILISLTSFFGYRKYQAARTISS